jgi:hypothetical protein
MLRELNEIAGTAYRGQIFGADICDQPRNTKHM